MDKYEKRILVIVSVLLGLFFFSILISARNTFTDIPECVPYDTAYLTPRVVELDYKTYQVVAVAGMWAFEPAQIEIPAGSEVDFYLTSKDVVHGFHIADKNINMMAVYGGVNRTRARFDKPGVYRIVCHEYCGAGHQLMQGEIIVYP